MNCILPMLGLTDFDLRSARNLGNATGPEILAISAVPYRYRVNAPCGDRRPEAAPCFLFPLGQKGGTKRRMREKGRPVSHAQFVNCGSGWSHLPRQNCRRDRLPEMKSAWRLPGGIHGKLRVGASAMFLPSKRNYSWEASPPSAKRKYRRVAYSLAITPNAPTLGDRERRSTDPQIKAEGMKLSCPNQSHHR